MTDWLLYAQDHINTSYEEVRKISMDRGEFLYPIDPLTTPQTGMFGNRWVNFYELGTTFYSAAKLLDDYGLTSFMEAQRHMYANTSQAILSSMGNTPSIFGLTDAHFLIPSVQNERLLGIFNRKRLNAERFVTANLRHAVELCLKALAAVANQRRNKERTFPWGHDLGVLYDDLPSELQGEIEAEVPKFADAYIQHVKKIEMAHKEMFPHPAQPETLIESWIKTQKILNQIIVDLNAGGYTVSSSNTVRWGSGTGAEQLIRALNDGPLPNEHRYGPKDGPDEYPVQWIANALVTGQFFYEHLFSISRIGQVDDEIKPLSEMRGPL